MSWRLLHILDHSLPLQSGYTARTLAILRHQRALGWHTIQLTGPRQAGCGGEQLLDGWHFFRTQTAASWWMRLPALRQLGALAALCRRLRQVALRERPDVLHAHAPACNAMAALRVGRALGIPVVYEIGTRLEGSLPDSGTTSGANAAASATAGWHGRLARALDNYVLRRVDAVTTICDDMRQYLVTRGVPADKVTVIPNAVDAGQFNVRRPAGGTLAHDLGLTGHLVLGFIGDLHHHQGVHLLIAALPAMLASVPSLQLLLVGGGPEAPRLHAQAAQLGLAHRVKFADAADPAGIGAYYPMIDIMVFPRLATPAARLDPSPGPLHAMAQGQLLVASDVTGHRELIEHGTTGMLFQSGDADALAAQVVQLLRQPQTWPVMRLQARVYVEQHRSWAASVARYSAIYQQLAPR